MSAHTKLEVRAVVGLIAFTSCLVAFACADSASLVTLGAGVNDIDGGPVFAPSDGGEAGALSDAALHGLMCATTECPSPFATCVGPTGEIPPYRCATDLSSDRDNCGACGRTCGSVASELQVTLSCVDGECQALCWQGHLDCNGIVDDGCEVNPAADPNHCGACGVQCPSGVACRGGKCGCPGGSVECDGGCVDLMTDEGHCGACGYACAEHSTDAATPPPHMRYACVAGQCGVLECDTSDGFWANCNGSLADGCETELGGSDLDNCGSCGNKCAPGKACFSFRGKGIDCQCPTGYSLCEDNGCYDLESDPVNCGSCGFACPDPVRVATNWANGKVVCDRARCGYECKPGFADCNGRADDGCEVELAKDPHHCGGCGTSCDNAAGQPCVNGQCAMVACDGGRDPR